MTYSYDELDRAVTYRNVFGQVLTYVFDAEDHVKVSEDIGQVLTETTRGVAGANKELVGVFTVDWNQPAPDGEGKLLAKQIVRRCWVPPAG